ncbi:hypothetical protein A0H81_12129 [Grifola frondosa]|uniref:Uncharacterized protein n=1 Tax=Grifola frondosa TaxID=5627 RepID=A0A1C7LTF8_GRIFR|nr:hypothetical protein A0H81_12129 [Grifola frondosa]
MTAARGLWGWLGWEFVDGAISKASETVLGLPSRTHNAVDMCAPRDSSDEFSQKCPDKNGQFWPESSGLNQGSPLRGEHVRIAHQALRSQYFVRIVPSGVSERDFWLDTTNRHSKFLIYIECALKIHLLPLCPQGSSTPR